MGTVDFHRTPEQAEDAKTADHRADSTACGCTLYFLLKARRRSRRDRAQEALGVIRPDRAHDPPRRPIRIPEALAEE